VTGPTGVQGAASSVTGPTGVQGAASSVTGPTGVRGDIIPPLSGTTGYGWTGATAGAGGVPYIVVTNGQITSISNSAKTFVIDHPLDTTKYLVHACLEGPEGGVYYRGTGSITNNTSTTIVLPAYVTKLATDFTIQLTSIYSGKKMEPIYASKVTNNTFQVYGENGEFYWLVQGKRTDIETEPFKTNTTIKGSGPYTWV
jgi:hypothetical protein